MLHDQSIKYARKHSVHAERTICRKRGGFKPRVLHKSERLKLTKIYLSMVSHRDDNLASNDYPEKNFINLWNIVYDHYISIVVFRKFEKRSRDFSSRIESENTLH